jgi:hypothetical protein
MENSIAPKKKKKYSKLIVAIIFQWRVFLCIGKKCKHPKSSQNEVAPPTHTMWGWFMEGGHEMFLYWPLIPYKYNG